MKLNQGKCELIEMRGHEDIPGRPIGAAQTVKFKDGTKVKVKREARYLGCMINDRGDATKELKKRMADCQITWKKLEEYWKHANGTKREKLIVYDAVIRCKLMYGLESVHLTPTLTTKLNVFQRKGLGQIPGLKTTYGQKQAGIQPTNKNDFILKLTNTLNTWEEKPRGAKVG